jgi:hypothetical protein
VGAIQLIIKRLLVPQPRAQKPPQPLANVVDVGFDGIRSQAQLGCHLFIRAALFPHGLEDFFLDRGEGSLRGRELPKEPFVRHIRFGGGVPYFAVFWGRPRHPLPS